ncbi:hypothetical protein LTR22_027581 [Elasticomyces elasticus]|nr:hypothetical protein LTR22_027581 [Elasticomyces elasticus]
MASCFLIVYLILIVLAFAARINDKRGGDGSSGGSSGGGGGGDGGDAGGGSGDSVNYGSECKIAQAEQTNDLYLMPASYYSGSLQITHKVTYNSAWYDGYNHLYDTCTNNDNQPKQYVYDAVLAVGPVREGNDTSEVFWSLQAYPPVQPEPKDARNEFTISTVSFTPLPVDPAPPSIALGQAYRDGPCLALSTSPSKPSPGGKQSSTLSSTANLALTYLQPRAMEKGGGAGGGGDGDEHQGAGWRAISTR